MKQKEAALMPILPGFLDKVPYTHEQRGKRISRILFFFFFKVSQFWQPTKFQPEKCQPVLFLTTLFQNTHSKLVSSGCEGRAHCKGRSIKLLPRPTRPKKNMRNYSASKHYVAQIEFCSLCILPLKPVARLTPKTKARAPGEARILIMQSRSLLGSKSRSWPVFHNLIDISCCSITLKEH